MQTLLFEKVFTDDFEKDILDKFISGDVEGANEKLKGAVAEAGELAPIIEQIITSLGLASDLERTATAKGIASASQDTVDDLNGRFTAIQSHTFSLNENVKTIVIQNNEFLRMMSEARDVANFASPGDDMGTTPTDGLDEMGVSPIETIQGHTFSIMENQKLLLANSNRALQYMAAIEENTFELHAMRADITSMKRTRNLYKIFIGNWNFVFCKWGYRFFC